MWEVLKGAWNGQAAADLYKGPLQKSLKRAFPDQKTFVLVEDGDKKGYYLDSVLYGPAFDERQSWRNLALGNQDMIYQATLCTLSDCMLGSKRCPWAGG